mgnify:CR=1 FL=1
MIMNDLGGRCGKTRKQQFREINEWLGHFQLRLSKDQLTLIFTFLDELMVWNKKVNLTGPGSKDRIIHELLLDSLLTGVVMPEEGRFLDIGSGAGFPAVPLKILKPSLTTHLVEPRKKRVRFLRHVIRILALKHITVIEGRIQDQSEMLNRNAYDVITFRALGPVSQMMAYSEPYLKDEGVMVIFRGGDPDSGVRDKNAIPPSEALSINKTIPYTLPGKPIPRALFILKKRK